MRRLLLSLLFSWGLVACHAAFAPATDGDRDTSDGDTDTDAASETYNVKVYPQFAYQGASFSGGHLEFRDEALAGIKARLAQGDPSRQSWEVNYGPGIYFSLIRFDAENLNFHDISGLVSASARTGERLVTVRITYGDVTVTEQGRFYVLPPQDAPATRRVTQRM